MAAGGTQCYTVFGFDSRVDWRPTVFVDGFPKTRVCSACGLVSATIALLPCHHTLCQMCYDDCSDGNNYRCPLEKDAYIPGDVIWSSFTSDDVLKRQIQCWNSSNGCDALGAVQEIVDHFQKDCRYHPVTCCRCKQSMAYNNISVHLHTNDCSIREGASASISQGSLGATCATFAHAITQLRDQLSSLQTSLQEMKELAAGQEQVLRERGAADMHVAESLQTLDNTIKESAVQSQAAGGRMAEELTLVHDNTSAALKALNHVVMLQMEITTSLRAFSAAPTSDVSSVCQNLEQTLKGWTQSSTQELEKTGKRLEAIEKLVQDRVKNEADIKERLTALSERLNMEACRDMPVLGKVAEVFSEFPLCNSEPHLWSVEGWSELKKEAALKGEAVALAGNHKYFYGYCILPGIEIEKNAGGLTLRLYYQICKGEYDWLLPWPFRKKLCLDVLKPEGNEVSQRVVISNYEESFEEDERPTMARNEPVYSKKGIEIIDIERNGCVKDDKVSVRFTVTRLGQ